MNPITKISIHGFRSIQHLEELELRPLNILIGANGSGKSNFIAFFEMLTALRKHYLKEWTEREGGPERFFYLGLKETANIRAKVSLGKDYHSLTLTPDATGGVICREQMSADTQFLLDDRQAYHFDDTTSTSGMVRWHSTHDADFLRSKAENLATFLFRLSRENERAYTQILKIVRLTIPFFDTFTFQTRILPGEEEQVVLTWRQKGSDYSFWPTQLSDGALRFICLATTLLQPNPPDTILLDEPELGLHPYAISLLGSLLQSASTRTQIFVSTQSVSLVNGFSVEDLIVVNREKGASVFRRFHSMEFQSWLENYTTGELWEKNLLDGGPTS